jgi:dipeptide/tripeptide permease
VTKPARRIPSTASWLIAFACAVAGMILAFIAAYNVTVWLVGEPVHHDASDMNAGLLGVAFGVIAAPIGAFVAAYFAARWLGKRRG